MVDWKVPVELPRWTTEEMAAKQREYTDKYGYYVTVPGVEDIIHLKTPKEPDQNEFDAWRERQKYEWLIRRYPESRKVPDWQEMRDRAMPQGRYSQVTEIIENKRLTARRIAASPMPTIGKNIGSVMTSLDDANDLLGTVGVVLRFAAWLVPRFAKRFFLGPVGWLFLAADIFGLIMTLFMSARTFGATCITRKRHLEDMAGVNPFSKEARTARARKVRRVLPRKGEIIEGLQTTDQLFGIGICLGPVVGFVTDVIAGTVRSVKGQKVTWFRNPPDPYNHEKKAMLMMRHAHAASLAMDEFTDGQHLALLLALNGATQILNAYMKEWNPLDEVEGLEYALFDAPTPEHPTTRFVLEEMGIDWTQAVGWPGLDRKEATMEELWDAHQNTAAAAFMDFCTRNKRNYVGAIGAQNAFEFALNMQGMVEGWESVEVEYTPEVQQWVEWHKNGCQFLDCEKAAKQGCMRYQRTSYRFGDEWLHLL